MLTETEVRDLLARAAATIDVTPDPTLGTAPDRRRGFLVPILAAAAAVLLVAGAVTLVLDDGPADNAAVPGPEVSIVPSVFGYDESSAAQLLTGQGLVVDREPSHTCLTEGRAVRTRPAAGTRLEPGDRVTLVVTRPPTAATCVVHAEDALAWQLLDFANGRGTAPLFASRVSVYVDGQLTTMTGDEAADPDSWRSDSALGLLATRRAR